MGVTSLHKITSLRSITIPRHNRPIEGLVSLRDHVGPGHQRDGPTYSIIFFAGTWAEAPTFISTSVGLCHRYYQAADHIADFNDFHVT